MERLENRMYEISLLLDKQLEDQFVDSIGHHVYEISLLLHSSKEQMTDH